MWKIIFSPSRKAKRSKVKVMRFIPNKVKDSYRFTRDVLKLKSLGLLEGIKLMQL